MGLSNSEYRDVLNAALKRLGPETTSGRIIGSGAAQFLLVTRGGRGVEIYGDQSGIVIIDPALGDELQLSSTLGS